MRESGGRKLPISVQFPAGGDGSNGKGGYLAVELDRIKSDIARISSKVDSLDNKLALIHAKLENISGKLDALPSASDFGNMSANIGKIEGRILSLPTWPKIVMIMIALGALSSLPQILPMVMESYADRSARSVGTSPE